MSIDLTSMNDFITSANANIQTKNNIGKPERVSIADGILTVCMKPNDKDGNNGCVDRRRNEIAFHCCDIKQAEIGKWSFSFRLNQNLPYITSFFHIAQLKYNTSKNPEAGTIIQPPFAISIDKEWVVIRTNLGKQKIQLFKTSDVVNQWCKVKVTLKNCRNGLVTWTVISPDKTCSGSYNAIDLGNNDDVYLKLGLYRSSDICMSFTNSISYKNITCNKINT